MDCKRNETVIIPESMMFWKLLGMKFLLLISSIALCEMLVTIL